MAGNIQITDNALVVEGVATPLADVLVADAQTVDVFVRGAIILALCLLGPIISMILGTVLDGYSQRDIRWPLTMLAGPGAVLLGIILSFTWKKPWAVVYEVKTAGYRSIHRDNQADAEKLASELNKAIS